MTLATLRKRWLASLCVALLALTAVLSGAAAHAADDPPRQVLVLLDMPAPHFRPDGNYSGGYADAAGRAARRRTAAALARVHGLHLATDWPMPALGLDCYVMDVPAPLQPDEVATRLAREPRVAWRRPRTTTRCSRCSRRHANGIWPSCMRQPPGRACASP